MVSSSDRPQNFPIYSIHSDLDSFILCNLDNNKITTLEEELKEVNIENSITDSEPAIDENITHESLRRKLRSC